MDENKKATEEILDEEMKENADCGENSEGKVEFQEAPEEVTTEEVLEDTETNYQEEIEKLQAEVEEWKGAFLRKQADFQNFTKRKEKELSELRSFASEKIITKLLDSVDNLERAVASSSESKDFDGLSQGVNMILGHIKTLMKNEGVEEVKSIGEICDPVYHHAVMVEDDANVEDGRITMELQKGYTMKGKLIRAAMVKVCKRS
ncbi:nucleotide exchange factor GrpE [Fusobacterium sp. PH5-44]|uniref:nucleotide exchange factor GrpE n=1 Tax=unclassified Fusobacterium TaxID=2648384 RepID=UPI003D1B4934